jgi:hypothetical protein
MLRVTGAPQRPKSSSKHDAGSRPARKRAILLALSTLAALAMGACSPRSAPVPKEPTIGWRPVASWSGDANTQTESFNMESGQWRIRWQTSNKQPSREGNFRAIVHSSVSGRFVQVAAEHQGAGSGLTYIAEDPRQFFLDIESSGVDWKVAVEEGVIAEK